MHVSASVVNIQRQAELMEKYGGRGGLPEYIGRTAAGGYEMEGVMGPSLKELREEGRELTPQQKKEALQLLEELHDISERAHGDLRKNEDNIRLTEQGESGEVRFIDIWPSEPVITPEEELEAVRVMLEDKTSREIRADLTRRAKMAPVPDSHKGKRGGEKT